MVGSGGRRRPAAVDSSARWTPKLPQTRCRARAFATTHSSADINPIYRLLHGKRTLLLPPPPFKKPLARSLSSEGRSAAAVRSEGDGDGRSPCRRPLLPSWRRESDHEVVSCTLMRANMFFFPLSFKDFHKIRFDCATVRLISPHLDFSTIIECKKGCVQGRQ